jgi:X-X-X-Leu-X-X-Gly heptad repeat protein
MDNTANVNTANPARGKAIWVLPIVGALAAILLGSLLVYPMLKMEPRNISMALLSLDQGVTISGTYINAGDEFIARLTDPEAQASADGEDSSSIDSAIVDWTVYESQEELDAAMANGEHYASLIIPADFSESQLGILGRQVLGTTLVEKLPDLSAGAVSINEGAVALSDGATTLASGITQLESGTTALDAQVTNLPSQVSALFEGSSALSGGLAQLSNGAFGLPGGIALARGGVDTASGAIDAAMVALSAPTPDVATAMAYLTGAKQATTVASDGLVQLEGGAQALADGLVQTSNGAATLNAGISTFAEAAPALASGVSALVGGVTQLSEGASALAEGASSLSAGTTTFSEGLTSANDALSSLPPAPESPQATVSENAPTGSDGEDSDLPILDMDALMSNDTASSIELIINQGKNPMVSSSLQSSLSSLPLPTSVGIETEYMNPLPEEMGMGFTHMILMILTYISSYATATVIANILKLKRNSRASLSRSLAVQLGYSATLALVIGFGITAVLRFAVGESIPLLDTALFIAIASFAFQLLVIAALDWFGMIGMVVPIGLLVIGMGAAYLPTEFLPEFWQQFVYPWDPLRFMVDGFKEILYMGQGFWNASAQVLALVVSIGFALLAANLLRPVRQSGGDAFLNLLP